MTVFERSTEIEVVIDEIWKGVLEVVDQHDPAIKPLLLAWMNGEIDALRATQELERRLHEEFSVRTPEVAAEVAPIKHDMEAVRLKKRLFKLLRQSLREI